MRDTIVRHISIRQTDVYSDGLHLTLQFLPIFEEAIP